MKQERYCQFEKKLHNRTHSHITFTFRGRESIKMCIGVNKIAGGSVNANARTFIAKIIICITSINLVIL